MQELLKVDRTHSNNNSTTKTIKSEGREIILLWSQRVQDSFMHTRLILSLFKTFYASNNKYR